MSLFSRVASFAAVPTLGLVLFATTTPGLAQQTAQAPISTLNALTLPQVPLSDTATVEDALSTDQIQSAPRLQAAVATDQDDLVRPRADDTVEETEEAQFATLSAAVAAQAVAGEHDRELQCLASGVFHESNGESLAGQLAVAQTIVNRAESGRFPKSICSVLTQRGQFSFVRGGVVPMPTHRAGWKTALAVAKVAYGDLWQDVAPKALFFHARHVSPGWRLARVATIGNHIFYR